MAKDARAVLGVGPNATEEEVTRAYRMLAKRYHPDLNPGDERAAAHMREINAAYAQIKEHREQETTEASLSPLERAKRLIELCEYERAAEQLEDCPPPRNAEWFCLSAVALYGLGEGKEALRMAKKAVSLKPDVPEYQRVLRNVKKGERQARRHAGQSAMPLFSCGTVFFLIILVALLLMFLFSPLFGGLRDSIGLK